MRDDMKKGAYGPATASAPAPTGVLASSCFFRRSSAALTVFFFSVYSEAQFHEEHLAIGWQQPDVVRHDPFEAVASLAQRVHRRNHLVAEVPRVLLGLAVRLVLEQRLEMVDA